MKNGEGLHEIYTVHIACVSVCHLSVDETLMLFKSTLQTKLTVVLFHEPLQCA